MEQQFNADELTALALYTIAAFVILLGTVLVFVFLIRKKVYLEQLKTKELEVQAQKNIVSAVIQTQEEERSRIAKDLHDDVSSKLNAIKMSLHILKQNELANSDRKEISEQTITACNALIENARSIAHNLMPPVLENIGLDLAIEELCNQFSTNDSLLISYENKAGQNIFASLSKEQQVHFYRIVQELINNSIRHGCASRINLRFKSKNGSSLFTYLDNGIGLETKKQKKGIGIGMNNIISRSELINGKAYFKENGSPGFEFNLSF